MSTNNLRAGTSPFAHLLAALSPRSRRAAAPSGAAARAEGDEKRDDDEEARKARRAEEDKQRDEENARRAEEDDRRKEEDARRAEEDKKDPEGKAPEGKRAEEDESDAEDEKAEKKAEDPDDDDEMARARREGFAAAQARARRIFKSADAGKRPDMAAHLACDETMPSAKAIAMLGFAATGVMPVEGGTALGHRMARVVIPNPGTGGGGDKKELSFGDMAKAAAVKAGILSA